MTVRKQEGRHYANKYNVRATCLTTGTTYEWPSISKACSDGGFCYNMIKLCLAGQLESYSGLRFETDTPRRSEEPSTRIQECADLYNQGLTAKEIADRMGITLNTVKFHKQRAKALGLVKLRKMVFYAS
ncbi:hypothetical protein [Aeromonas phage 85AhydR10PP]|nr:hypothetical protein [Aeromonas phage 85AhydR10PP]